MSKARIREARADEAAAISRLALRSKGHWGYSNEFLEACAAELTFSEAECGSGRMWVAITDRRLDGFSLLRGEAPLGELAALFVEPSAIGTGCGKLLLCHTTREASAGGFTRLAVDADSHAEPFYVHFGATRIGVTPSGSIPGRVLTRLELRLDPGEACS